MVYLPLFQDMCTRLYLPIYFPEYTPEYHFKSILHETDGNSLPDGAPLHSRQHYSYLLHCDQSRISVQLVDRHDDSNIITRRIGTCFNSSVGAFRSSDRTAHAVVSSESK